METSGFMLAFGVALVALGGAILYYLINLCLNFVSVGKGEKRQEPDYVREINGKLISNNVETERDLM